MSSLVYEAGVMYGVILLCIMVGCYVAHLWDKYS